ncbi:MAG: 16S rRNA (uracil(1498)-N(3))-methyltransferase [Candidatus Accumulibacter phosphatis]|jgi:16S rRNA (uracil1498-N3)-methyltransferase|uniref:Ribosomal RNA small subunit methyltransferase E n=1 Tax=Candidatus Accumulibacter phosphatis TaxID=327160 RepID=A0A6A7RS78_9PROT|nr:16S rRNA (uracil(1498)-N(3))-methyltransferase [Candidatus Accumulibacter phosphatis]
MVNNPRFHCPIPLAVGSSADLPDRVAHHASKVLRLRSGAALTLFTGAGGEYSARIVFVERSRVSVEVLGWLPVERESPLSITLVQALQAGEKMDLTVQKAVELGVQRIVPVISRRSVVRLADQRALRRLEHWRGVVAAACEQCGRNRLPEVAAPESVDDWLQRRRESNVLRLLLAPAAGRSLSSVPAPRADVRVELLIGAEGGLAAEEMQLASACSFLSLRLGPRILRTETAGLAALAAIQFLWGDLKEEMTDV